jgi:2,3,4,5-tetrahydropyridine-2,6-dicarboxylate N-succinyltransferase
MTLQQELATIRELSRDDGVDLLDRFLAALERGEIRSASRGGDGRWEAQAWVKQGILEAFRIGVLAQSEAGSLTFVDKDTIPPRRFTLAEGIRVVPGGTSIRRGAFVAKGVVVMPPAFVNVGAYVDEGTMIDSHALVGSCAQIGKRVHLSAAAQVGGVLEPVGTLPVIIEDDVVIGGNAGVYEGTIVRERAVIGAGVVITGSTPVYDNIRGVIYRRTAGGPLEIPAGAVVIPGSRPLRGEFALEQGLSIAAPVIVKYRDEKTDSATALEEALR